MTAVQDRPWAGRGGRYGWVFAAVWLVGLSDNLTALYLHPAGWPRTVGFAALAGFAVAYLVVVRYLSAVRSRGTARSAAVRLRVWAALAAMLGLAALQAPGAGQAVLTCFCYLAAVAVVGLPLRQGIITAVLLVGAVEVLVQARSDWQDDGYVLGVVLAGLATWGIRMASERQVRLTAAQHELAALAVADERARIAADLHDILGHSLTVVTVKAELAQRLLDVDLDKARKELQDLETLARDALSDVRATALGVRGISLPGEIAAARSALAAANVTAELPGAADEVPSRWRELFAWTIREAVTNVVRHAGATHVEVRLGPRSVEIVDDGVGPAERPAGDGQGLPGLRRRAAAVGAQLTAGSRPDQPGFRVRVEVPS